MAATSDPTRTDPPPENAETAFGFDTGWRDPLLEELARTAYEAATAASEVLRAGAPGSGAAVTGLSTKISETDMVSDVDRSSEAAVNRVLLLRRPDDGLLAEEGSSRAGTTGVRWVVDPLDGTTNFLFGIPQYAVSIAAEVDGEPVVGLVLDPCRSEIWAAARGHGAFRNGSRCQVRPDPTSASEALVATGFAYKAAWRAWQGAVAARMLPQVRDLRRFGSAALDLSWVGGARFDGYYEWGLNPWDLRAGELVAREAGAEVRSYPNGTTVAATSGLFGPLCDLLGAAGAFDAPPAM
jgi:fructose-1,6-bisphosphatase/inositol monophosphatase family enzyme